MSIYVTLWELRFPHDGWCGDGSPSDVPELVDGDLAFYKVDGTTKTFLEIYAQAVPPHIDYTGPAWDPWLPPPVDEDSERWRAVFICGPGTTKGTERCAQELVDPLVVLSGAEYEAITWRELWGRIEGAVREAGRRAVVAASGRK